MTYTPLESLCAWLLHRFGPDSPEGREATTALRSQGGKEEELLKALGEIANRAGNYMDPDAGEWMPSIYKIACEAIGEDPNPSFEATGFDGPISTWPTRRSPPESIKARLDSIAPAVENLACHQEQCDMDGVMVKVSRQAVDEVVNAINEIAISIAAFPREEQR